MASPSNSTVTIDGNKFNAFSVQFGMSTVHDDHGMPMMGSQRMNIEVMVDMHDTDNLPFSTIQSLFNLSHQHTREKIVEMKIEYWKDESQIDPICVYSFRGWIANYQTGSGSGTNHTMLLQLQPTLDLQVYMKVGLSN